MDSLERHLTFAQIADLTGMSNDWARRAWKRGEFGSSYLDLSRGVSGHEIRIPESGVLGYLNRRQFHLPPAVEPFSEIKAVRSC